MTTGSQRHGEGQRCFRQFLEWLDGGIDSGGENYVEMHRRLVAYFDRKNCSSPADLADETLNRVARRLEEEGKITGATPARYCYIVARFVFLEHHRQTLRATTDLVDQIVGPTPDDTAEIRNRSLHCLDQCLGRLEADQRELILEYYRGEQGAKIDGRRRLAEHLGITSNAVSVRACRIRERLEACVRSCTTAKANEAFSEFRLI
jgi:DNA-directed RNA polymerase specialized sigma24 family protein